MLSVKNISYLILFITISYLLFIRYLLISSYSLDLEGAEVAFLHFTQLLLLGEPLYRNPCEFPFLNVMYVPGYPYLLYFLAKLLHYNPSNDIHEIFILARTLSFLTMFLNLYFIYAILKKLQLPFIYVLTGITFYLLLITGHFYATRPDCIKTTAFTASVYLVIEYLFFSKKKLYFILFLFSGLLAICVKQDALLNIYVLLIVVYWYLRSKDVLYLLIGHTICTIICFLIFYLLFGRHFFTNTIFFNLQVITDVKNSYTATVILGSIIRNFPLLLLAAINLYRSLKANGQKEVKNLIPLLSIVFFCTSHLSMMRTGSNMNYTYELILFLILNVLFFIRQYEKLIKQHAKLFYSLTSIYLLFLFASNRVIHSYTYNAQKEISYKEDYFSNLQERAEILAIIKDDITFFQNPTFIAYYPNVHLVYGYEMHFERLVETLHGIRIKTQLLLFKTDIYDRYFKDGKVKYIITGNTEPQKECVRRNYSNFSVYKITKHFTLYRFSSQSR